MSDTDFTILAIIFTVSVILILIDYKHYITASIKHQEEILAKHTSDIAYLNNSIGRIRAEEKPEDKDE
jgi:hypothetical protein